MLVVEEDKKRDVSEGQILIELIDYPDIPSVKRCNRLSYWCDKEHLKHFVIKLANLFTKEELEEILNCKIIKDNECKQNNFNRKRRSRARR